MYGGQRFELETKKQACSIIDVWWCFMKKGSKEAGVASNLELSCVMVCCCERSDWNMDIL